MELAPGGSVERPVTWPEDFPDEAQRGKTKTVQVQLRDVKRKSMPALDDALARELGDFETLDALDELTLPEDALVEEMLVVAAVIIAFLLHLRSALLPIISVPLAVAIAFIPMVPPA